jgi:hypothetical protein
VEQALAQKLHAVATPADVPLCHRTKVSPWLDLTQWERYFRGRDLSCVTRLLDLLSPYPLFDLNQLDDHLVFVLESFDRLIKHAHELLYAN